MRVFSGCLGLSFMSLFVVVFGCGLHDKLKLAICIVCQWGVSCGRVIFYVVNHLFVVVFGCGPRLSHSLAIFCCMYCVPVGGHHLSCGRVLWLPSVTFYVVNYLFVVVFRCGPHDKH